jgi:hypothetical protein
MPVGSFFMPPRTLLIFLQALKVRPAFFSAVFDRLGDFIHFTGAKSK